MVKGHEGNSSVKFGGNWISNLIGDVVLRNC